MNCWRWEEAVGISAQYLLGQLADGSHALGIHSQDLGVEPHDAADGRRRQPQVQPGLGHAADSVSSAPSALGRLREAGRPDYEQQVGGLQ